MIKEDIYSDINAMDYELLIRRAFSCGRNFKKGADADIYRRFIRKARIYRDKVEGNYVNSIQSENQLLIDYEEAMEKVVFYLNKSLIKIIHNHSITPSQTQIDELERCRSLLVKPSVKNVVEVITCTEKIMLSLGLFPS